MARRAPLDTVKVLTARITTLEADRETAIAAAVTAGATWAEIGRALGVTAQAAHKRYRWLRHSPVTGETWHEPPLPQLNAPPTTPVTVAPGRKKPGNRTSP